LPGGIYTTILGANPGDDFNNQAQAYTVNLGAEENMTADFGYNWAPAANVNNNTGNGAIGDHLWIDDGDGIQEPGEPGLGGIAVKLYADSDGDGNYTDLISTTTTSADGSYIFLNVAPGSYIVEVNDGNNPSGYTQTGDPDENGSACSASCDNQTTNPIVLAPGDVYLNADFGYQPSGSAGSIGNMVWFNPDGDSSFDTGEYGIPGVTVALIKDSDGDGIWDLGEPIIATDITDSNGEYTFSGLPLDDGGGDAAYLVWVNDTNDVLGNLVANYDQDGASAPASGLATGLGISALTLSSGNPTKSDQDFGYEPEKLDPDESGVIGDTIFLDRNGNNSFDFGEGLEGVEVDLYDSLGSLIAYAVTNEQGYYYFGGLPADAYTVTVVATTLPGGGIGLTNTLDPDDDGTPNSGDEDSESVVILSSGEIDLDQDFGYRYLTNPNTIAGTIWKDTDADGYLDSGAESTSGGIAGVTVVLYDTYGHIVAVTTTDSNGDYTFDGLPDGTYLVHVSDEANLLDGYWHSIGSSQTLDDYSKIDPYQVSVAGGETDDTADFGYYREPASVGDFVWDDLDQDGIQDGGEPGISGVTVQLAITWPGGASTTTLTALTDSNGAYNFGNLLLDEDFDGAGAGEPTFLVTFTTPATYSPTTEDQGGDDALDSDGLTESASPVMGQAITNIDSGFKQVVNIGDTLWYDWNGDGTQDANEPGIPNIDVFIDMNNNGVYDGGDLFDTTDANGQYNFNNLATGTYRVIVRTTDPDFPAGLTQTADPDSTFDSEHTVVASAPGNYYDVDFGYRGTGSIGNFVWNDMDGDGVQDATESGISGVTIWIDLDGDGNLDGNEPYDVTDANGEYYIGGLATGTYTVTVYTGTGSPVNGATPTYDMDGTGTANLASVALTVGLARTDVDFGYQFARLDISKTSSAGGSTNPGDTITYTIIVQNNYTATQTSIVVSDTLPVGTTYVSSSTVVSGIVGVAPEPENVADDFNPDSSYSENDGSQDWSSNWIEYNDGGDHIQISNNLLRFQGVMGTDPYIQRSADLSNATSAILSFDLSTSGNMAATDEFAVFASSSSSGTFTELQSWFDDQNDMYNFDLSDYISDDTTIRFQVQYGATGGRYWYVDNVDITYYAGSFIGDDFSTTSYSSKTTGSEDWASNWTELGETTNPSADQIRIVTGELRFQGGSGTNSIGREANLSGATAATLTMECHAGGNHEENNQDYAYVYASGNGGSSWTLLGTQGLDDINNANCPPSFESFDLSAFISADTRISITHYASATDEYFYIDEVKITIESESMTPMTKDNVSGGTYDDLDNGIPPYLLTRNDNFGLQSGQTMTITFQVIVDDLVALASIDNTAVVSSTQSDTQEATTTNDLPPAAIGDRVWLDEDGDGIQDAGEDGIPNVTVELRDGDCTPGTDCPTTVTDANGNYLFTDVDAGSYTVAVIGGLPAGLSANPTYDEDGTGTANTSAATLYAGQTHLTADFGYNWAPDVENNTGTGAIGDRVWNDADGDGAQDLGEAGIKNVTVRLYTDPDGDGVYDNQVASTTTDAGGNYIFDGLAAGSYEVRVVAGTTGYTQTGDPDQFGAACTVCDARTTTPVVLAPGDVFVNADFGYRLNSNRNTIGNQIFLDVNGDGDFDSGTDEGIPGVSVTLLNGSGEVVATTVTDSSGIYNFTGLPDGTYTVWVNDVGNTLKGLTQSSTPDNGNDNGQPCGACNDKNTVNVSGGSGSSFQDFGYKPEGYDSTEAMLGDTIFMDYDDGDDFDVGEGLEGVRVELYESDGNTFLESTVTNVNGYYFFTNLNPASTYVVKVDTGDLPGGLTNSVDPDGGGDSQASRNLSSTGPVDLAADFGYVASSPNSIAGTVWEDTNADGTFDGAETDRFGGVTIVLRDSNGYVIMRTTTLSDGTYGFTNLPNGDYTVDVTDDANVLSGYWHTLGTDSESDPTSSINLSGDTDVTGVDFGYFVEPASLGDFVWLDRDDDGIQDTADEPGIMGITVTLTITYPNGNVSTIVTLTDKDGAYSFGNLLQDENFNLGDDDAGTPTYQVSFATPPGASASPTGQGTNATDSNGISDIAAPIYQGQTDTTYDSGFYTLRLDLGDLPSPYATLFKPGPAHIVFPDSNSDNKPETAGGVPAVWLGTIIDVESNGQPSDYADGDDNNGDDEDGVTFPAGWQKGQSANINITLNSSASGVTVYYGMWIDWDVNGTFDEFFAGSGVTGSPIIVSVPVTLPLSYTYGNPVFFRVRADDNPFSTMDDTGTRVNGEVEDHLETFSYNPTAVTMGGFVATAANEHILLEWNTILETDMLGFNLYRSESTEGERLTLNVELLPSMGFGAPGFSPYSFIDSDVQAGVTYYYWLEVVNLDGEPDLYGPLPIRPYYTIYMPLSGR
jgi:uncharacterized repeat protein (TIGR01451 family)